MGGVGKGIDYLVEKIDRGEWNEYRIYHHFYRLDFREKRGVECTCFLSSSPHFRRKHSHSHLNLDRLAIQILRTVPLTQSLHSCPP